MRLASPQVLKGDPLGFMKNYVIDVKFSIGSRE